MTFSIDNPEGGCNNPSPLPKICFGIIGHIQIILSDHVSLKIRNTNCMLRNCFQLDKKRRRVLGTFKSFYQIM